MIGSHRVERLAPSQALVPVQHGNRLIDKIEIIGGSIRKQLFGCDFAEVVRLERTRDCDSFIDEASQSVGIQIRRLVARVATIRVNLYAERLRCRVLDLLERAVTVLELDVPALFRIRPCVLGSGFSGKLDGMHRLIFEISWHFRLLPSSWKRAPSEYPGTPARFDRSCRKSTLLYRVARRWRPS